MFRDVEVKPYIGAEPQPRHLDVAIAELAARQHGVVARAQLAELGLGRRAIGNRLERGRLHLIHRCVYAVGHRSLTRHGRWMAAVLACGPGAALSHRSAGALEGIRATSRSRIEVTVPAARASRPGIQLHRNVLPPDERTTHNGIPVTTVPRTLLDLAAVVGYHALERAVHEAEALRLGDALDLQAIVDRYPGRRGVAPLRKALASVLSGAAVTRSELEARFRAFLHENGLPPALHNVILEVDGHEMEVDCLWPDHRLIVELDGRATHATARAFESDRARDRILQAAGWRVVRVTWRHLHDEPEALAADLGRLLA